jgi:hypothetical protein
MMVKYTGFRNSADLSLASSAAPEKVETILRQIMLDVGIRMMGRTYDLSLPEYLALDARLHTKSIR